MATTISDIYKKAIDNGVLSNKVSEERFAQMLQNEQERKAYWEFANKQKPNFYSSDYDVFSKNASELFATTEQPKEQPIAQHTEPQNPSVKDNPAPTTEKEYQEKLAIQNEYATPLPEGTVTPAMKNKQPQKSLWQRFGEFAYRQAESQPEVQIAKQQMEQDAQQRIKQEQERVAEEARQKEVAQQIEKRRPMFEQQWNGTEDKEGDVARLDKVMQAATEKANAAAGKVADEYADAYRYSGMMGGSRLAMGLEAKRAYNKEASPDVIMNAFTQSLDEDYQSALDKLSQQTGGEVSDEVSRPMTEQELAAMYQKAGIMSPEDCEWYRQYVQGKLQEKFAAMNVPKNKMDYFVNKFMQSNLIGQLATLYTSTPYQRAAQMQGVDTYEQEHDDFGTKAVGFGADVAGLLADPTMLVMPMVGSTVGGAVVRGIAGNALGKIGYASAQDIAARAMMQRGILQTANRLAGSAFTFAGIDATHDVVNQLYQPVYNEETGQYENGDWQPWQTAKAAAKGAITGTIFGGAGLLGDRAQHVIGEAWNKTAGLIAGKATHFVGGTNAMVGTSVVSQILQGRDVSDINWGEEYANAAAMQLVFDIQGGVRNLGKVYRNAAESGKPISLPEVFKLNWQRMKADPYAGSFTQEEIEQFNKAGYRGKDGYEILLNMNGGKEYKTLNELYTVLDRIAEDPTIDTQAKYRLASLIYGKTDANVRPVMTDSYQDEQGRYVVRTYDNAGQTYETRYFNSEQKAQDFRNERRNETQGNLKEWQEGVIKNYFFATEMQRVADAAVDEIQKQYPQYTREQLYNIMRESMLNPHTDKGKAIAQDGEASAIRSMFEEYLSANRPQSLDVLGVIRQNTADNFGITLEDVRNITSKDYRDLDMRERGIYDDYVSRLSDAMPRPQKAAETQQTTEPQPPQGGAGTGVQALPETIRKEIAAEVEPNINKDDGNVYAVTRADDETKRGYVVSGKVEIDGTDPNAPRISNNDVVTVRYEDGTVEQLSARDLNLATTPTPAADVIQNITDERVATAQVAEQVAQTFRAGQEVTMDDGSGNTYTSHVVSVSTDGVEVEIENAQGEPDTTIIPNEIALTALHPVEQRQRQPEQQVEKQEPFEFVKTDPFGNPIVVEQPEQIPTTPQKIVPNIDTMLADELGASVVEYLGDKASAIAYLEAERDKADDDVKRLAKQKVTRYTDIADFKRQNDELQAAKKAAADQYNKLQNAIATANNYKTKVEQAAEAERKAREEERRATRRQTQTAQLANADPAERWKAAPKVEGNAVTRTLSDGTVIKGHYILVEAGAATPSHDPFNGWNTSNGFPVTDDGKNINDRDYKNDTDAQQITTQIAQTYDGQAVAQVPVVSSEGIVYDGNGRTIAGNIAAANNTDGAYIQALADNAGNFGFAPEQVAGMQHPRVYMQTDEDLPYNTTTFSKFNAQEKKSQGSTNRAVSSSKKLTDAARDGMLRILDDYGTLDAFFASENGAKDIVRSLLDNGIITQQEVAGLTENTDRGFVLSPAGKDYVTDLLIGGLFDEQTIRMLGNDKGLKQSILRAMPSIVENRRLGDYALTDNINNAIRLLYEARQAGMAYPLYVKQGNAFDGYVSDRFSPFEMLLVEEMSSGVETFRQVLNLYNNSARDEANGQTGLFEPRTFDDIKKEILQHYGKSTNQSAATAAESTQSRPANTQTEPPVPSTPTGDGQGGIASTEQANSATEESSRPNEQAGRSKANNRQKKSEETPKGEQTEDNSKEQSQSQQSGNKIFTEDAYEAARRRMHERLNRLNAGLDPEMLSDGLIMAGYHVEKGARKFAEFAREMIREFGDKIRPYLKSFYNGLRDLPEAAELSKEMDDYGTVAQFDVNRISIEEPKAQNNKPNGLMEQYSEIKKQYPNALLLFRMGDDYELYAQDAVDASKILNIGSSTTNRLGEQTIFAQFPYQALDLFLPKLVRAGRRVAICDPIENIQTAKSGALEVVTPQEMAESTEKSSETLPSNEKSVSLQSANAEDTQPIGKVTQSKHTKTGEDIWIVKPSERVSDDEFKLLKARAKANNGYYSSFAKNRGFIFKSKEDANNFNNISDEEITTDQTSADTETAVRTAETVVGETATITRDRRDSNRAEGEPRTESIEGGVREPRNVELTPEQANEQVTTRQQAIAKIDNANDKITDQLAVLGFYEADTSDPTKLHESYGYIKTAEAKAVKDIDRLAKQLADDLGIKVSKRKTIAKANIAPAGGDISFRLPLENGKELYLSVDIEPNFNDYYRADGDANSLVADHMFWRIEDPQANGTSRYLTSNQNYGLFERGQVTTTYADLLRDIRRMGRDYLSAIPTGTTKQEIAKQIAEKTTRKKKDTTRIADTQSMLDLFGDVAETMNEGAQQEQDGWNPQASTDEELQHGYNVGDKVQYQGKTAEIVGFDNGRLVLDLMGSGWNTKLARFDEIEHINTNNNGDTTEIRTDGRGENGTAQTEPTRQSRDENGTLGGSKQPQDERPVGRRVDTGSKPHRVHDGERSTGTPVQPTEQTVTQSEQTDIEPSQWRNTHNFHARGGERLSPTAPKARYEANLAAIRLLKQLQDEGIQATAQEKDILAQYSGWGGLGEFFKGEQGTTYYSQQGEQSPYQVLQSLLTDEELQAAQLSRNSAYYTPESVINSMWQVAERLGFKGGNILEGSAGIGNIFALMPSDISHRSNLTAVEIDDITAGILSQLYPDATTYHAGFQDVDIPNNSQDLVITNVPFVTGLHVYDKQEKDLSKRFGNIHDFCIAKNVRKLKQGGLGIFISSSGTLDNSKDLRVWLNNEGDADVIGAFRLNRETFGGTSATSDIIVVRKRVNGQKDPRSIDVLDTATDRIAKQPQDEVFDKYTNQFKKPSDKEIKLVYNKYFVEHPLSMGGEMGFGFEHGDTRWGGTTAGCYPEPTINQSARLKDWIDSIEQSEQLPTYDELKQGAQVPNGTYETYEGAVPYGSLILNSKGEICKAYHGTAVPVEGINSNKVKGYPKSQVLKDYNAIKQSIDNLLQAQTKNVSDSELKPYLQQLNKVYDDFVRKYGNLNRNTSLAFLRNDVQWASVAAIEKVKETVDVNGKKKIQVAKTDLFSKRVVGVQAVPKAENTRDGIILSMQQFGTIRPDKIAEWLGKPTDEVEREIIGTRLGFRDPQTGNIQVRYEYLSGNVREKLAYAMEHNENGSLDANIEELRKVIPIDIPAHLIEFNIGSTWIPKELYLQYAKEKYDLDNLKLNHVGSAWVSNDVWGRNEKNRSEGVYSDMLGIQIYGHELMLAAMNNVPVVVSRVEKHSDGTSETRTDKVASAACSDKISQIKDDFVDWARGKMQQDSELADRIQKIYNDRFNAIVPMLKVDKEFLSEHLPGQNSAKYTLYPHQQQAVARGLTQALMLAHEVGTGKTISLISTAMEMRRLGTAKKPMIVVQNATTQQFVADAKDLYPNAKILTVSDRDRTAEGRQEFYAKIKYNDWDLIIVPQSVFDMIPDSEARMRDFINEKIEEKMHAIEAAKEAGLDNNVTKRMERELGMLQEDLETNNMSGKRSGKKAKEKDAKKEAEQRANTEARAQAMLDRKTDDIENFDEMGIDALLIDEAHNYKHLGFATMMTRGVKGVDPSYSKRAAALYLKCQSIYERNGHKNVIFATGTPISNTAAEIWTFMKYLMPKQTLQENEIYYFDDFVHNFGKINEQLEFATNGKFKANNRFAQYGNVPELMRLWLSVADCTLTREVGQVNDKVPELEGGKAQDIFLPQSPSLIDIMSAVRSQLEMFEKMSGKEKRENSYIPLTMYGIAKRAAIDPRLVDANAVDEPLSKTNRAVEEILRSLNDSKKYKGTVAIFCDSYQNKQSGFNLFNDIKEKLTKQGVSSNQIAIIRGEMSDSAKQKIFDAVREGDIRVIMGSTQTLGTGVNIQTRLHTLIHMDAPDRPMDYTQRNGRILRQGNMHKEWGVPVRVLRFGVEDSLDVTSYQRLKTKAGFIDSVMNGKSMIENNLENRVLEDVDEGIFDNPVAMLSGSQYALLKSQAERDLRKWSARAQQYRIDQILIAKKTKDNEKIIAYRKQKIADNEKLIELLSQTFPGGKVSEYNINGTVCHTAEEVKNALKEVNKDVTTESDALRKDVYGSKKALSYPITLNGVPFNVDVQLTRKVSYKDGQSIVSIEKEVLYSAPTLGIEPIASPTKVIDRLIDMIQDDIISGKQARDENAYSADYIKRLEKENALMREREGKPFEHQVELEKAQTLVDEYTKKMQAELAEKEAKYANQSHNSVNLDKMDSEDDTTDTTDTPEAQYDELDYDIDNLTDAQQFCTDVVLGALDDAGISVERVSEEQAEREVAAQKKSLDDTATWSELMVRANKAADITSNDNAKVLQKIETAKQKIANQSGKNIKNIAGVIADAAELSQRGSSHYGTFKATNGDVFTIRVSNHNATVSNFDNENEADGVSIVISNKPNIGISNDGSAHIVEYFYRKADLLKSYGNPIADILGAIKTLIESGEYTDPTGLAQRQEVNIPAEFDSPEFSIVYHGSGNKFSHFDHSHMGEGEGQQAYGWGTYVSKQKGVSEGYARRSAENKFVIVFNGNSVSIQEIVSQSGLTNDYAKDTIAHILGTAGAKTAKDNSLEMFRQALHKLINTARLSTEEIRDIIPHIAQNKLDAIQWLEDNINNFGGVSLENSPQLYTVEIPDDIGSNYLSWNDKVGDNEAKRIGEALYNHLLQREGLHETNSTKQQLRRDIDSQFTSLDGSSIYGNIEDYLGSAKETSQFLNSIGYTGIKVPINNTRGAVAKTENDWNYVIFNEDDLQIKNRAEFLRTSNGTICGYAKDGKIYLTDKGFNPNTPIHEYTHLWVKAVRNNNAELYDNLRDLFSRENLPDMWNELDNDPQYRDLSDEAKLSEIIARFSGKRGAERMEQEAQKLIDDAKQEGKRAVADAVSFRERMRNLLRRFWNWVGEHLFRIKNFGSREEAADRVLYDLLNGTDLHQSPAEKDSQAEFSIQSAGESAEPTSRLTRSEVVTKILVQNAKNDYNTMQAALNKVSQDIKGIRAAMRLQSGYDRNVVSALLNLYNTLLQSNNVWVGYMPDTTQRVAAQIVNAIGKQDINKEVNTIMDYIVDAQTKAAQRQWDKLRQTPIDKINISGVVAQGKVALQGQYALKALNNALESKLTASQLEEMIGSAMANEENATDESLRTQYKGKWIGYSIAQQHMERIGHLKQERQQLLDELDAKRSDKSLKPAARQQVVDNIKEMLRDNNMEQTNAYIQSARDLQDYIAEQGKRAKGFIEKQNANREKIRDFAAKDLAGVATNPNRLRTKRSMARSIWDAFASPIRDLQSMLRLCGMHAPDGEGYLYNHFMRNWMDGADRERQGIVEASQTLDNKIADLTHGKYKTWEEAARKINNASHNKFSVTMLNGVDKDGNPVNEEILLNAGNALYIYAVNKMADGKMKLAAMNITDADVEKLTNDVREKFGQEIIGVVDWIQSEYFSQLRNRYNPIHEDLFGAPMDAIENYFPLRINANARQKNEDLGDPDTEAARLLTGTSTGAIKRRTRNTLPLDVRNADFFSEVIRHIAQMERWSAFAQWTRDANILFSDIDFRNRIKGMDGTIYGSGEQLYNYMKDAFRVAVGTYKPNTDTFSEFALNAAKGVTSAKINFRLFTAIKQLASFPAFFTYMTDGVFVKSYMRNWLKPHETMKWANETLPNFEKRVSKRDMGDMRLMQRSTDWQWNKRILEISSKYGMAANVLFDTLTCATGARAVYDSRYAEYKQKGYTEEEAANRARQDAEMAFNTSQQSSEGVFMAPIQLDRNLATAALTVFRTSNFQYTRNLFYNIRNLKNKLGQKEEMIASRKQQYIADGLTEEQAQRAAEHDWSRSNHSDIIGIVVYGALLNLLWRLFGNFPYLIFGDDNDKKAEIAKKSVTGGAFVSPVTGLLGGGIVEQALDGYGDVSNMFAPELPFTQDVKKAMSSLKNDQYAEFTSQALSVLMQSGAGFDPQTAADMIARTVTTLDSEQDLDAAEQALRVSQAVLSIPQSQYEQMLIDEVIDNRRDYRDALADYKRYISIHKAPLTWYMRSDESENKTDKSAETRFKKLYNERKELRN